MDKVKGPWTVKEEKIVYENPWIVVKEDNVVRPDGSDGIFATVTMKSGVTVLPLDAENNVYLVEEYQYAIERVSLEAVSGGIEEGEAPRQAAERELKEETGLSTNSLTDFGMIDPFTSIVDAPNYLFLAEGLLEQDKNQEGTETMKIVKIKFDEAYQLVQDGSITHGATVALILKLAISLAATS